MLKRVLALLLIFVLSLSAALAEEGTIASYALPEGAQVKTLSDAGDWTAPQGLETMYALMLNASKGGDVYLVRMPKGRALCSISCTNMPSPLSAQELLSLWPQIAQGIANEGVSVDGGKDCARIEQRFGRDVLSIQTTIEDQNGMRFAAVGYAFCRGTELMEIWTMYPQKDARSLFATDVEDAARFIASLDFDSDGAVDAVDYTDPDGRFAMSVLKDGYVITADTPQEEAAAVREKFIAANKEGAAQLFDTLLQDVRSQRELLLVTADMKGLALVFVDKNESFTGFQTEDFRLISQSLTVSLTERFGAAWLLSDDSSAEIAGVEHAWLGYQLRTGECDVQLDILACTLPGGWLCEVDIFTMDGDTDVRNLLYSLVKQTLQYTVGE